MSVPTLEEFINELSEMITGYPDGLPSAMLHLYDDKGEITAVALATGSNPMISPVARLVVARQDPALAVLAVEATSTIMKKTVEEEPDPDKQRVLRGEIPVSKLPIEKQQKLLMIYGEDRAGNEGTRMWTILPSLPGWRRRYKPWEHTIVSELYSRLRPLYSYRELMAEMRLNEYQARKLASERAAKELVRLGMTEQNLPTPSRRPDWTNH